MTQDEIIEMAMQAEFILHGKPSDEESELFVCLDKDIVRFANLVAAKEREACALICERVYKRMCPEAKENEVGIEAEIIRSRGET